MIREAITYVDQCPDRATQLELFETLRKVTEGKVRIVHVQWSVWVF
jgi:hypothetical protein